MRRWLPLALVVALGGLIAPAQATSDRGREFSVSFTAGAYGVGASTVQHVVRAADGTSIFVENWLPVRNGSHVPPRRVPVVVVATPYALKGLPRPDRLATPRWKQLIVSHGYALANVHLRGTGESGGCWDPHGKQDAEDVSRALDWLTTAPFSDGRLALLGKSHDGGAAINVAERGDRHRLRGLKALVVLSPIMSYADMVMWPGVPDRANQALMLEIDSESRHTGRSSAAFGGGTVPEHPAVGEYVTNGQKDPAAHVERAACDLQEGENLAAVQGGMTPWLLERESALHTDRIRVPVLMSYGTRETQTRNIPGAFDGIRAPKAGVFSSSEHDYPDENSIDPSISRRDWVPMVFAWLDRWVRGVRNGVESWPVAQVQSQDGQWRAEPGFPETGGPAARLALGPGLTLGASRPTGSTSYLEETAAGSYLCAAEPTCLSFASPALTAPLEVVGAIRADLWATTTEPDARIFTFLTVYDAAGNALLDVQGNRSLQYVEPEVRDRFVQTKARPAPVGIPVHVLVDYPANDIVVPVGGWLELSFARQGYDGLGAEGRTATITLLHDCAHPSALTFLLPRARADWLDVLDGTQRPADLGHAAAPRGLRDGGGLASQPVCGRPVR
jgi:predicted acyl esterase